MHNQQFDSSAIEKLQRLIKSRYGKEIKLRQLNDARMHESSEDSHLIGDDLHVALKQNDQLLGTVVVPQASDLKAESRQQMSQMIRMVMEPTLYTWYLERKENNLKQINTFNFSKQNLSVFDDLIRDDLLSDSDEDSILTFDEALDIDTKNKSQSRLLSKVIHLTGKTDSVNRKVALQIHDMAHRWAFVPIQDMASSIFDANDLKKLGALTLFVSELEKLDQRLQDVLVEYASSEPNDEEPLIISTSQKTSLELKNCPSLVAKLKDFALTNNFEVDQAPLSYAQLKDVLEMFFFKPLT